MTTRTEHWESRTVQERAEIIRRANCHADLVAALKKILDWFHSQAAIADEAAKDSRFPSLAEAYAADARNYRAMVGDIKAALAKAGE